MKSRLQFTVNSVEANINEVDRLIAKASRCVASKEDVEKHNLEYHMNQME